MILSVIIVNYNVKYFLEQCLCSVQKAMQPLPSAVEVFVVDNHSTDGSLDYLESRFPWVKFLAHSKNEGYAKANNRALSMSKGKYVLFLNPDTLIAEDSLSICISRMEELPDTGAIGVKMVDGSGKMLRESKRGFPSPWVSFCKLTGLTALFPQSRIFARYYLGHLSSEMNHAVDCISGAFFLARKSVLDQTGGFDERFFMYAEDIDLSYRIQQAGHINRYVSDTTIIHFKGESTRKDIHYIRLFYKAMRQFVKKYSGGRYSVFYSVLMDTAIFLRAIMAYMLSVFVQKKRHRLVHKSFLWGPEKSREPVERYLQLVHGVVVNKIAEADTVIFCEGEDFSFKKMIAWISNSKSRHSYWFHASQSRSVVGSAAAGLTGQGFALDA